MSILASLKENKPLAIVVGVSLVLTIALIVTLIVLDNKAQKQVDELTEQATGTRAALDLAIQELEACGKLDEFVENVKDIPGAPELLETSGALSPKN
jgi:mannitol-specific phosphotransferase system IIBC component